MCRKLLLMQYKKIVKNFYNVIYKEDNVGNKEDMGKLDDNWNEDSLWPHF